MAQFLDKSGTAYFWKKIQEAINEIDPTAANLQGKSTTITSESTDDEVPTAKAVYDLFSSIIDGNEVSF